MHEFNIDSVSRSSSGGIGGQGSHEHITHIGNSAGKWRLTRQDAITQIEMKVSAFYTVDGSTGKRAYIGVVREQGKAPYLRTHADGKWNDNLLAQPECSGECRTM
ncbi:DUF3892 domain-containing protein [Herbaspirillum sp. RV1423]|uniref:DUF3892 domain-containing protein n=1 Tax=Herbaspirillum sp. RV1423 TaxID=1443993 RepID=UPI0004B177F0|nr:DUF3892 domain-containing protein [Herbaspirillum sp. RV1423]